MSSHRDEGNWKKYKNSTRQKREGLDHQTEDVGGKPAHCTSKTREIDRISKSECDEELLNWRIE